MSYVVLEGLDGAGTTTQTHRLVARLARTGHEVVRTNEPTDREVGRLIRRVLQGDQAAPSRKVLPWLFAADRADHLDAVVRPALARGDWVVSDRYLPSSLAYQSLEVDMDEVWALNETFEAPDRLLFLRVSVETALERINAREGLREIYETREHLEAVAEAYEIVLARLRLAGWTIAEVDGEKPPAEVEADIAVAVGLIEGP